MDTLPFSIAVRGIQELPDMADAGVTHVLSILDPEWPVPDAFAAYAAHERLELRFHDVIEDTPGLIAPAEHHVAELLAFGRTLDAEPDGGHLLVHCHAGISRSTASMILMILQARPALSAREVAQGVLAIREKAWPNLRLIEMGERALGREGEIVDAVRDLYGAQLVIRPHLAEVMTKSGRGREVALARMPEAGI
jgi:predicted protein tyrosine phosphatase